MELALRDGSFMDARAERTKFQRRRDPGAVAEPYRSTSRRPNICSNVRTEGSSVASSVGSSTGSRCESPLQDQEEHLQPGYHTPSYHPTHQEHQDGEGFKGSEQQQQRRRRQQQQQQQQQPGVFIRGADRRALQNLRVIRRTLVYAIGLSPNFAQVNTLKQPEYFGQYGDITKLVINHHHGVAQDDPRHGSASAYVSFRRQEDAWAAICSVDGFRLMGRTIRASFGTTKYCNSFLRNLPCNNPDCLYLHELGDEGDRFTKDEVQLGLARHGSSFAFKEEVLGERVSNARRPANPVFPPPYAMPPASFQRDSFKHQQQGCGGLRDGGNGPCEGGHAPLPPPPSSASARVCQSCGSRGGGGGGGGGGVGCSAGADARWAVSPMGSGSPLPLGGPTSGSNEERTRPRRRRGQRGRRGAGNRSEPAGHGGCGYGLNADAGSAGGGGAGGAGSATASAFAAASALSSNTHLLPVPPSKSVSVGSNLSVGSGSSSTCGGNGSSGAGRTGGRIGRGNGLSSSSGATSETRSPTPPLVLSPGDRFSPTAQPFSFQGLGAAGDLTTPPSQDLWNRSQYQHPARPVPKFVGLSDDGTPQEDLLDHRQSHTFRHQHQHQQQHPLFMAGGGGIRGVGEFSEARRDLNFLRLDQQQQHRHDGHHHQHGPLHLGREQDDGNAGGVGGGNEKASIAALQLQVNMLQRYVDSTTRGGIGGGRGAGATSSPVLPPSLGGVSGGGGDVLAGKSVGDDLSFAEDRLAALSWHDADPVPDGTLTQEQQQEQRGRGFSGDSFHEAADGRWTGADSAWGAAAPIPLSGLGSPSLTSAVSQTEPWQFSQWRRATPGLFT